MPKFYAVFDKKKELVSTLVDSLHAIPKGAIEISHEQQKEIINGPDIIWYLDDAGEMSKKHRPPPPVDYEAIIANTRYLHEISGVTLEGGMLVATDRDSQGLISGAMISAIIDPEYRCTWKTPDGPVALDSKQLSAMATSVRAHVQACFDREFELLEAMRDGTLTEEMITQGWPS